MPRLPAGRRGGEIPGVLLVTAGQAPKKKHFTLPIPQVPKATYDAIASRITKFQPWLGQKAELDKAQQRAQSYHDTLSDAQETLKELEGQREQALRDVQEVRLSEIQDALQVVEKKIQREFDDSMKQREKEWETEKNDMERQIENEVAALRVQLEKELEEEQASAEAKSETDEPSAKRSRLDPKEVETGKDKSTSGEASTKEEKVVDKAEEDDESKLSFAKKQEVEALQKKADELVKLKNDMTWLVIALFRVQKKVKKDT